MVVWEEKPCRCLGNAAGLLHFWKEGENGDERQNQIYVRRERRDGRMLEETALYSIPRRPNTKQSKRGKPITIQK